MNEGFGQSKQSIPLPGERGKWMNGKLLVIDDVNQVRKNIDEDPIIKDSMANIVALVIRACRKQLS